jgi:hypothetical protein
MRAVVLNTMFSYRPRTVSQAQCRERNWQRPLRDPEVKNASRLHNPRLSSIKQQLVVGRAENDRER